MGKLKILNTIMLIVFIPSIVFAWTPPIGIPTPSWPSDLDVARPSLPDPWNSNSSGFYYIKNGGSNSGNGYPGNPRDSIPASLSAGDVVVLDTTVDYPDNENVSSNGTPGSPIWIMSYTDGVQTKCTGDWVWTGSYVIVDDLNFDSGSRESSIKIKGDYIMLRDIDVTYTYDSSNGAGLGIYGGASYSVVYGASIGPLGNWQYTGGSDIDQHGIKFNDSANHIWVLDSEFYEIQGDGIQIGDQGYSSSALNHIYIAGNTIRDCNQTGLWAKVSEHVIIAHNSISRMGYYSSGGGGGACIGGQYEGNNLWVIYNTCYDSARGISIHGKTTAYVLQNVIYGIWADASCNQWNYGGIHTRRNGTYYVLHNTLYNNKNSFTSATSGTKYYRNNVSYGFASSSCPRIDAEYNMHTDYNLWPSDSMSIHWSDGSKKYSTLTSFADAQGMETHRVIGNPQFTDAGANDFTIQSNSDAIDASYSSDESIYNTFFTNYGESIKFDKAGNARPSTFADWDLGAYEYQNGAGGDPIDSPPTAPKNLRIVK